MSDSQFDELVKTMIQDHRSPVPENMWERIVQKKSEDRKGFVFFFRSIGLSILLVAVCLGGYFLFDGNIKGLSPEKKGITNNNYPPVSHAKNPAPANSNSARVLIPQNLLAGLDRERSPQTKSTKKLASPKNTASETLDPRSNKTRHKIHNKTSDLIRTKTSDQIQYKAPGKTPDQTPGKTSDQTADKTSGPSSDKIQPVKPKIGPETASIANDPTAMTSSGKAKQKNSSGRKPSVKIASPDSAQNRSPKKTAKNKVPDSQKWYLDLYGSPDLPIYDKPSSNPNFEANEKMKISYSIGLKINRSFGKHFSGKIGIQFSQINYDLIDSSLQHSPNHLKSIDIPLLAGYSIGNEKYMATLNAGAIFNFHSWYAGSSLPSIFKSNTGVSLYIGLNLATRLNEKLSIFGEPYFRYRLSSMTVSSVDFNKFIDVAGISLGVRYHFKK
jgi:hypothetical protein